LLGYPGGMRHIVYLLILTIMLTGTIARSVVAAPGTMAMPGQMISQTVDGTKAIQDLVSTSSHNKQPVYLAGCAGKNACRMSMNSACFGYWFASHAFTLGVAGRLSLVDFPTQSDTVRLQIPISLLKPPRV
jgi:hypothetical protein